MTDRTSGPERALALVGCPNFRDAGGYRTADVGSLQWRRLFRSGHLALLTEAALAALEELSLDLVVDLRRTVRRNKPCFSAMASRYPALTPPVIIARSPSLPLRMHAKSIRTAPLLIAIVGLPEAETRSTPSDHS